MIALLEIRASLEVQLNFLYLAAVESVSPSFSFDSKQFRGVFLSRDHPDD